jgi:alpha-tubulin suppressor-like RCC1 family protein
MNVTRTTLSSALLCAAAVLLPVGNISATERPAGHVLVWGDNYYAVPRVLTNAVAIAAGYDHGLALKADGTVAAWGYNDDGQCDVPDGLAGVVAITTGSKHSLALVEPCAPRILAQPGAAVFRSGESVRLSVKEFSVPKASVKWRKTGSSEVIGEGLVLLIPAASLADSGSYYATIENTLDSVVSEPAEVTVNPDPFARLQQISGVPLPGRALRLLAKTAGERPLSVTLSRNGESVPIGADGSVLAPSLTAADYGVWTLIASNAYGVATATLVVSAPEQDTAVLAWGNNEYGQCAVPEGLADVVAIAVRKSHNLALKVDGTVVAWGNNGNGQCDAPNGLADVVAIAAGYSHSLALKADGTVVAWGDNGYGQRAVPNGLADAVAIAAGYIHSLVLKTDGTVAAWGDNGYGQCTGAKGLADVVAIAAGSNNSLALKTDGTVAAWGNNGYGQCDVPEGLADVVAIAAGSDHSLALKADGTVVAWGDNYYGQCDVPDGLTNAISIAAGYWHSLALKADGTAVAWGSNYYGQCAVPKGLADVVAIAAGYNHTLAIRKQSQPQTKTAESPVPVPYSWLEQFGLAPSGAGAGTYEVAALADTDQDGMAAWQEFVALTDPTNPASIFLATIDISPDGLPLVSCTPKDESRRHYETQGKPTLSGPWGPVDAESRFFRVRASVLP